MEFFKLFIEQSPNAVAMFDRNMNYLFASDQWLKDYNLVGQNIIGKSHYDVFPEIGEDWKRIHQECMAGATNISDETEFIRGNGSSAWIKWLVKPWYDEKGIGGILMSTGNITEQKNLQKDLEQERRQFQGAFETASIGMAIVGLDGKWHKVNSSLLKLFGYSEQELIDKTFQQITHPDDLQRDMHLVQRLINGKQANYQMEKRYIHKNGSIIWALLSVSIVMDATGKPLHFVSQMVDISLNKKLEQIRITQSDKDGSRIAFELHENIAQSIAAIKMILQFGKDNQYGVDSKLNMLIEDIKLLSAQIMPSTFLEDNIADLVEGLIDKTSKQHQVDLKADLHEVLRDLLLSDNFHVFKIIEDLFQLGVSGAMQSARLKIEYEGDLNIVFKLKWQKETGSLTDGEELLIRNVKTRVDILEGDFVDERASNPGSWRFDLRIPGHKLVKSKHKFIPA